jgi:hypothetical protein
MEFEEIDGKIERKFFAIYFSTLLPESFLSPRRLILDF